MKFQNFLIVSDMDGTFCGERASLIDKNLDAIDYFQRNGGIFTIATGRDYPVLEHIFPNAAEYLSGPAILCNGSYLYDFRKKQVLDEQVLVKEEFLTLLEEMNRFFPEVGYRISSHKGFLCPKKTPQVEKGMLRFPSLINEGPLSDFMDIPWHKCVFVAEPETILKISKHFQSFQSESLSVIASFATLFEVLPKKASKGKKMERLKEFYPGRTAICVGDYSNDLDMLSVADIAACPENALDEVKAISKIHLCHHREGCIADLIYKLDSSTKE